MDIDTLIDEHGPAFRAEVEQLLQRSKRNARLTGWMGRIPFIGRLVQTFWFSVLDEGFVETCRPRWGTLTFSFLNDGFRPSLYHTFQSLFGKGHTAIWMDGAPTNRHHERDLNRAWAKYHKMHRKYRRLVQRYVALRKAERARIADAVMALPDHRYGEDNIFTGIRRADVLGIIDAPAVAASSRGTQSPTTNS